jgi:predicted NBD/HSP70 family sugar kinase
MASSRTGSLESLRERNRRLVVDVLRRRGAVSRAEIARQTGLSRSTVSTLVGGLKESGLVTERELDDAPRSPGGGRPPVLVALDRSAGALVGLDFGHDHVRVAIADLGYQVLAEEEIQLEVDEQAPDSLDAAADLARALLEELGIDRGRVVAAGMGLPGPVDTVTGKVRSQPILPSWVGLDPAHEMGERLGFGVHLDNDANVGALGEWVFGAGRGHSVMAYVRLSAGIGSGLILDGRPFRGAHGIAGELGHVHVDPNGPICRCGNRGCLETLVAPPALCELLRRSHGELTVHELIASAEAGDPACRRVIQDAGGVVGRSLADLCNYVNPDVIVIGGELSKAGELLREPLVRAIRRFAIPAAADGVEVVLGVLDDRAEVLGALALAGQEAQAPLAVPGLEPAITNSRRNR